MRAVTLTLHPAIDRIISTLNLVPGETFDGDRVLTVPAGKGVNTARALSALLPSPKSVLAIAWMGPQESDWFARELKSLSKIRSALIARETTVLTRNAYTFIEKSGRETHIKEAMRAPNAAEQTHLLRALPPLIQRGDLLAVCGSAPAETLRKTLEAVLENARKKSPRAIIADTNGVFLEVAAASALGGIKGNAAEIGAWLKLSAKFDPKSTKHRDRLQRAMQKSSAPRSVMVTLGVRGAYFAADRKAFQATPPLGFRPKGCAATGCGDAATAGWLWALARGLDAAQTVRLAVACGTAKTSQDPGLLHRADVEKVFSATRVQQL